MLSEEIYFASLLRKVFFWCFDKSAFPFCVVFDSKDRFRLLALCVELFLAVPMVNSSLVGVCCFAG